MFSFFFSSLSFSFSFFSFLFSLFFLSLFLFFSFLSLTLLFSGDFFFFCETECHKCERRFVWWFHCFSCCWSCWSFLSFLLLFPSSLSFFLLSLFFPLSFYFSRITNCIHQKCCPLNRRFDQVNKQPSSFPFLPFSHRFSLFLSFSLLSPSLSFFLSFFFPKTNTIYIYIY